MPRNEVIEFKVTAEEKKEIRAKADENHETVSAYVRNQALDARIKLSGGARIPPRMIDEAVAESPAMDLAKERKLIENDPSNLNVTLDEKGSVAKDTREEVLRAAERDSWIASTARILMMEKGLSKVAATMQASKEWDKR